jgi:hypothetical protein
MVGAVVFALRLPALKLEAQQMVVALQAVGGDPADEETGAGSVVAPRRK